MWSGSNGRLSAPIRALAADSDWLELGLEEEALLVGGERGAKVMGLAGGLFMASIPSSFCSFFVGVVLGGVAMILEFVKGESLSEKEEEEEDCMVGKLASITGLMRRRPSGVRDSVCLLIVGRSSTSDVLLLGGVAWLEADGNFVGVALDVEAPPLPSRRLGLADSIEGSSIMR